MSDHWFAWKTMHPADAEDPASVWAAAHQAGYRQCLRDTSKLAGFVPLLSEFLLRLRDMEIEADIEHDALLVERREP